MKIKRYKYILVDCPTCRSASTSAKANCEIFGVDDDLEEGLLNKSCNSFGFKSFEGFCLGGTKLLSLANLFRGRETFFNAALGVCRLTQDGVPFVNRFVVPFPAKIKRKILYQKEN